MLFKNNHLNNIKKGNITLAFRKWQKPSVKIGTLLHTSVGLIEIKNIEVIQENDITTEDAINSGFKNKEALFKSLSTKNKGDIFKIAIAFYSEDPRIKLREQTDVSDTEFANILSKLNRLDKFSKEGVWTTKVLQTIEENPNLHAIGIAALTGFQKEWLKINIRKLKNLGLTISHSIGYEISPRGKVVLQKLIKYK